ncbi:MAG: hypothetical protein IKF39_06865 [Oscillospiraceae bacterium]|nr:hypothetical protein [Oscillospiraceae bacterium]
MLKAAANLALVLFTAVLVGMCISAICAWDGVIPDEELEEEDTYDSE